MGMSRRAHATFVRVMVAANIECARRARGCSQSAAALALGWEQSRLSKLESGLQVATVVDLADLSDAYGVTLESLVSLS